MVDDPQNHIYVAVSSCGRCVKVGISRNPAMRVKSVRYPPYYAFRLVRTWQSPHSRVAELIIRQEWRSKAVRGAEYFNTTPLAAVRKVQRELRLCAGGKQPKRIPGFKYAYA